MRSLDAGEREDDYMEVEWKMPSSPLLLADRH